MVKSIDKWVGRYEQNSSVATDSYRFGVSNPKRPPASAAIAARKTIEAKMRMKETWDKWESGLRSVGDDGVIKAALEKGADRYAPGIRAGLPKVQAFAQQFAPHLEAGQRKVFALPNVTPEDSERRMLEMSRHNRQFKFKR